MNLWSIFPRDIKLQILDLVAQDHYKLEPSKRVDDRTAGYATVCKEWQEFFEKKNFELIDISRGSRLLKFKDIVQGPRRRYVKHIWLRIVLPLSGCRNWSGEPGWPNVDNWSRDRIYIYHPMVHMLFKELSTWNRATDLNVEGDLTLEFSIYSSRDSERLAKHKDFGHDPYRPPGRDDKPFITWPLSGYEPGQTCASTRDSDNFWKDGVRWDTRAYDPQTRAMACRRAETLISELLDKPKAYSLESLRSLAYEYSVACGDSDSWFPKSDILPTVDVVTRFLVRRQYYRSLTQDELKVIFASLVGLKRVDYEFWRKPGHEDQMEEMGRIFISGRHSLSDTPLQPEEYCKLVLSEYLKDSPFTSALPRRTESLSLFEEFSEEFAILTGYPYDRRMDLMLGLALAVRSLDLKHCAISGWIDATHFFTPFWPSPSEFPWARDYLEKLVVRDRLSYKAVQSWIWDKLETLALTSQFLHSAIEERELNKLLEATALAARHMPKLQVLEIWNHKVDEASIFRYKKRADRVGIVSWQSTYEFSMSEETKKAWSELVDHVPDLHTVHVTPSETLGGSFSLSAVLSCLELRDRIVHPVSAHQIRVEHETMTWSS
ncbi:hypothetical protein B0H63DRAFT_289401 [Podospora didyma]|uniref:DUF6546 domain-containing protein n=1 Tax=Podospora didyma TaxID=330526 RepID=A0AAE0KA51_9PEZI|nr:hypothetical protein B0H63DRAFT_289401 [Podospora didyma]